MGANQDQVALFALITSQQHSPKQGDVPVSAASSANWLTKDGYVRARRVSFCPISILLDSSKSSYKGTVDADVLSAALQELGKMF